MNISFHIKKLIIIYLILSYAEAAVCQTEKQLLPADIKQQTLVTEPVTLKKGFFRAGTLFNYRIADKYFTDSGKKEYYVTSTWGSTTSYNLTLQYGISDRFQVDLITEYMYTLIENQSTETDAATNISRVIEAKHKGLGLGDTHVSFKYQLMQESKRKVSCTGIFNVSLPTGEKNPTNIKDANQYDLPVGDGTYAAELDFFARSIIYPYSFTGFLGYRYNFEGKKITNTTDMLERKFRYGNHLEGGLSANLLLNEWIVLANELNFYHEGKGEIDNAVTPGMPASWALSYSPGLVFQVKKFRLGESVKVPLKGKNVPADPLYVMMIQYVF
jgi:hypothetical protein